MRQFDVFPNPSSVSRKSRPFVVVLQSDFLSKIATVVVAPLAIKDQFEGGAKRLHPQLKVSGQTLILAAHELAAIPRRLFGKPVANIESHRDAIISAIDFVFLGF